jgi:hypothetical protein
MQVQTEKRLSTRVATNSFIKLIPNDIEGNVLNISETGISFECEGAKLSGSISLLMTLCPSQTEQPTEITVRIIRHTGVSTNRMVQYGAQFASLDGTQLTHIRRIVFNHLAKKASAVIENNEDLKTQVEDFFNMDVKKYYENFSILINEASKGKIKPKEIETSVTAQTDEVLLKGYELEQAVNNKTHMKSIRQVFRETVGCWCYKSPIIKMAYDKQRGYPGDYQLFEAIYDNKPLSEDNGSIGFYCDKSFLKSPYCQAARARKNKMKNILQDFIENTDLTSIKLLNIACGPSREIRELLSDPYLTARKNLIFTGLDHDEESLKFSKSKLNNLPSNIQVRLLHENVLSIFRDPKYYDIIGKHDIIYILGLTEYLPDRIFKKLTHFLFQILNEKGKLVITYKDEDITFPSLGPEWFCDWTFIKRAKNALIDTAKTLGTDNYSLKIEREGTGYIYFLILTKT